MALINYVEPVNTGAFFGGVGMMVIFLTVAYVIYRFYSKMAQYMDVVVNRATKYEILEGSFLDKIGQAKGIDLNKELVRRKMFEETKQKSFRKKIEDQIYEEMFGKETKQSK